MRIRTIAQALLIFVTLSGSALSQSRTANLTPMGDPRGPVDLTICSQNLKNYGSFEDARSKAAEITLDDFSDREGKLALRFAKSNCDVIAVQELLGKNEQLAKDALDHLATRLRQLTNRTFETRVGPVGEGKLTLGFMVAKDRAEIVNTASYDKVELPKLSDKQKPRLFSRGPFEIQIISRSLQTRVAKTISLVNMHFKSQRGGSEDPAALEWETFRMEMAEALRRIVERRFSSSFASSETLLVVLGDRNCNFDTAAARILEGSVTLKSFQGESPCRLSKLGVPLCKADSAYPQRLFSVLTTNSKTRNLPGTFFYKNEASWLDEILMPAESLPYTWITSTSTGEFDSGVVYEPKDASDHAMVYVRLNW